MHNFTPTEYIFDCYASSPIKSVKDERNLLILPAKPPFIRVVKILQSVRPSKPYQNHIHIMILKTRFFCIGPHKDHHMNALLLRFAHSSILQFLLPCPFIFFYDPLEIAESKIQIHYRFRFQIVFYLIT